MNERARRKIAVDKDDVLIDFNSQLCQFHNQTYGTALSIEDFITFDFSRVWGCSEDEAFSRVMSFYQSTHYGQIKRVDGAMSALERMKRDHDLLVLTARPEEVKQETIMSVTKYFPGIFSDVHFAHAFGSGQRRTKAEVCLELGVELLIDDSLGNVRGCRAAGIETYLYRRPWNMSLTDDELRNEGILPVRSWSEILTRMGYSQ